MSLQNNNSRFNLFRIASCDSCVLPWRTTKKIFRVSQQRTENSIFRVNFRIGFYVITTMILQISNSRFNLLRIESFESWVCFLGEPQKKSADCRSKEQRRAFSELSFELALALWLQWFCKIPFPDSTSFELKVLIAECVTVESHEKKICWLSQQGTEKSIFRVIFRIGFEVINAMILQNTISRYNFFRIASFDSWVC